MIRNPRTIMHPRGRGGFTLVELLIGTLIAAIVIAVAFQVLVGERRSAEARREEMNAQQNLRVAIDRLTRDIRMAGFGVDEFLNQPRFLDAGPWQVAFNGDITSGVGGDAAMDAGMQIKLSGGATYNPGDYPGENLGGEPSYSGGAETIVLGLDSNYDGLFDIDDEFTESVCPNDFSIYRGVNGLRTERLAFGLRGPDAYPDGTLPPPLFQYWGDFGGAGLSLWGDDNGDGSLSQTEVAGVGPVTIGELSNILYVEVEAAAFSEGEVLRTPHAHGTVDEPFKYMEIEGGNRVRPRNVGVNPADLSACGDPPARPNGVWVQDTANDAGSSITVHFHASSDEMGGEEDVTHYFVYRREAGGSYGPAIAQVPAAGISNISFANDFHTPDEANVPVDGVEYYYRISAWDCKPQESGFSYEAGPVSSQPNGSEPPVLVSVFDTPCDSGGEITVIFDQSPDEAFGSVDGYRVFRGPIGGDFLSKTLIGYMASSGSPSYTFLDNVGNNVAGAPPIDDEDYWYTVRAVNDTIISVDSNELGPVGSNDGLSAALLEYVQDVPFDDGTRLTISWLRSESESCMPNPVTGYRLERKGSTEDYYNTIGSYSVSGDPAYAVEDSLLLPGQPYLYRVVTLSSDDEQASNAMEGIPTNNIDLLPPTAVVADGVPCDASGAIRITWHRSYHDNGSGDVEKYRIWRREEGFAAWGQVGEEPAVMADDYQFDDNAAGADPPILGTTYEYIVTAFNETLGNESGPSNQSTCTAASMPDAPYLSYATDTDGDHGGSITLKFYASDDDGDCTDTVSAYFIYRSEEWGSYDEHSIVGEVAANDANYYYHYDNGSQGSDAPEEGHSYYYVVRAYDGEQLSVASNQRGPVAALDDAVVSAVVFLDGFESDTGWTHGGDQDDFQRGNPTAKNQTYGESDPADAYLGDDVYGNDIGASGWNGTYRGNADSWLMSPRIDCGSSESVNFSFNRWLNVEQPIYDRAIIEVSGQGSGGPWTEIWRNDSEITDTAWIGQNFNISNIADGKEDVRIRFRLETDGSWHYAGWNIDEIKIIGDQ